MFLFLLLVRSRRKKDMQTIIFPVLVSVDSLARQVAEEREKVVLELTEKHNIQLRVLATKTKEEMRRNFSALEEQVAFHNNQKRSLEFLFFCCCKKRGKIERTLLRLLHRG